MKVNIRLPKTRVPAVCLFLFSLFFIHQSCTKIDTSMPAGKAFTDAELVQRFFDVPATAPAAVHRAADALRARDHHLPFAAAFARLNGIPKWDKATVIVDSRASARAVSLATEEGDTLVILPVLQEGSSNVESFISMRLHGDADMAFYRGGDYSAYTYEDVPDSAVSADKAALQIMWLNYRVSGTTRFIVNDDRLFMPGGGVYTGPHPRIIKMDEPSAPVQAGKSISIQICTYVSSASGCTCWHRNPSQCTCTIPDCCWRRSCWYMNFPTDGGPFDDGGSGSGGDPGGDQGGGGSPGFPCADSQGKNIGIANPCGGGGPVIPPVEPIYPYDCHYQLTQHESDVWNQIDAEDEAANNNQNPECRGTNRAGNVNFQGTKEHWLLQLDYLMKNPTYGEAEYAIPGASIANPANKGFADIVNTLNGNMFEIKPDNIQGQTNGMAEVQNYVLKANISCSGNLPFGTTWNPGTSYQPTFLPGSQPNQYLQAHLVAPGVIGYSYVTLSNNPIPSPYIIPETILDKIKQLVERLKNNATDSKRIISEFLNEHPELLTYIKEKALQVGVAIIVGTILEDIITAGGGIVDDLASFALAYRIVRFAITA